MPPKYESSRLETVTAAKLDGLVNELLSLKGKVEVVKKALRKSGKPDVSVDGWKGAEDGLKKVLKLLNNCQTKIDE